LEEVAPGVARLGIAFVNAYMVGAPGGPWVLLDAGLPRSAMLTRLAAAGRYGAGARSEAIVLTHGHFDHAGAALDLATEWDVPIYAYPLEMAYLRGKSAYPPQDTTMRDAIAQMAWLFPRRRRRRQGTATARARPVAEFHGLSGSGCSESGQRLPREAPAPPAVSAPVEKSTMWCAALGRRVAR